MVNNFLKSKHKPHALLIVDAKASNLNEFIDDYMKSILPSESAHKIDSHIYHDIIMIDGYSEIIKKEQITNIVNVFSHASLEKDAAKFYLIYGIENATTSAINTLLKFLEEPPINTYAILTTRSLQRVLDTIKSRCQVYRLQSNFHSFDKLFAKVDITDELKKIIHKLYYSAVDAEKDLKSKSLQKQYEFCKTFVEGSNDLPAIKNLLNQFKKFDYQQIEHILKIMNVLVPNNPILFELIDSVKFNPTKTLLFNKI
jgi:DNA polymerase-3 subunit delta'